MQGLILAAGMGKRLGKYTKDATKCMVKVNNKPLIEYALEALYVSGIRKTVLVIGYEGKKLKDFLGSNYKDMTLQYVENNIYDKTNNIYSLWLAKDSLAKDDTILLESDLIFEPSIISDLIKNSNPNVAVVAKYESWMDGTVTIIDQNESIVSFIPKKDFKWISVDKYYKTVNIYKFSKDFSEKCYIPFLEAYIKALGQNEYYEQVLRVITFLENIDLKAHKIKGEKWYEIDDIQDLDIAEVLFCDEKDRLNLYQKRYGGYWRFGKLKDFCYLVNPYFPNEVLYDEIKSNLISLISQYPSGLNVQNLLAAKMFDCDSDEILIGNGASELIRILMKNIKGKIGVITPTFNEYGQSAGENRTIEFDTMVKNLNYSVEDILNFSKNVDNIVLINPDNPSGHCFSKEEIINLLDNLKEKVLILDESFIDFAGEDFSFTCINSELIQKYKNLVLIKSISKSYGVPGIRLGVMVSGNKEIIKNVRDNLPIWNINSFGEYFLQIIGKYKSSYKNACIKISEERDRFYNALCKISFLKVFSSKANYFLCEVTEKYTSTELCNELLNEYSIFIKDCNGKKGFEEKQFVRIAVRNKEDNDYLIKTLETLEKVK